MNFKRYSDFKDFSEKIKHENRYIHDEKVTSFLNAILETSKNRQVVLSKGDRLWRAQLGNDWRKDCDPHGNEFVMDDPCPYLEERMKPIMNSASEGRANPKGISYLYLATNETTAITEVRPWKGSKVSVGLFEVIQDLNIVECGDFSDLPKPKNSLITILKELTTVEWNNLNVWQDIDEAFSVPINTSDKSTDYIPTQVIAEFFKSNGFDGIAFKSSLSSGANVVLFDLKMADLKWCSLYEVTDIDIKFKHINSYTKGP